MRHRRSAMRRRERFARVVDASGEKPDDPEMARLAGIVAALRSVSLASARTREAFHAPLRRQLVASAGRRPVRAAHAAQPSRWRMLAAVGAFTFAVVMAVSSVATAEALPGDPFYGVKQAAQTASLTVAASEQVRGERELRIAEARLADLEELVQREDLYAGPAIEQALDEIDARTRAGNAALTQAYGRSLDIRPLNVLDAFARDQESRIAALLPALPWPARSRAQDSLRLVQSVGDDAVAMLARSCRTDASCRDTVQAAAHFP